MGMMVEDEIVMKRINEIRPYIRNPRKNEKTVELLCDLIPKVGFNVPIVIDKKGVIVKGHARFSAAIRLGMTEVPCIISHADPEAIKADRITDNKISEFSEWMNDKALEEVTSINSDVDFSALGFPVVKYEETPSDAINKPVEPVYEKKGTGGSVSVPPQQAHKKYYKCVCLHCGHVQFVEADKIKKE